MAMTKTKRRRTATATAPRATVAEFFMARLGWKPSTGVFHTTAKRECGSCRVIKPGTAFAVPVTPGRPDLNKCRECM
jgi:hypothetical protein